MIICNKCGEQLPEGNRFCFKCGSQIISESKNCSACGQPVNNGARFCGYCGSPIGQSASNLSVPEVSAKPFRPIVCELCGGNNLVKENGFFTCQHCGTKYSLEEARKMMIEGTVQVAGTVKVDNTEKLGNYLMLSSSAFDVRNYREAEEYANKVIEIDPQNAEAWFIKGKSAGWQSTREYNRLNECVQCWSKAIAFSGNKRTEYQQIIANELPNMIRAYIELKTKQFGMNPTNSNAQDLTSVIGFVEAGRNLQKLTQVQSDEKWMFNHIASNMIVAATEGFNTAKVYFGLRGKDRLSYKFDTWIEYTDNCINILTLALQYAQNESTLVSCYNELIEIENTVITSKGFVVVGLNYVVDKTLSKEEIKERKKFLKQLAAIKAQHLQRIRG